MLAGNETHISSDCDDELKMFRINKSSSEGESRSLVFRILRTTHRPATEKSISSLSDDSHSDLEDILHNSLSLSPSGFPPEDNKFLPFDSGVSPEDVIPENYSNVVEIPYSPVVKSEPDTESAKQVERRELRRSSRIQALQSKSDAFHDNVKEERNPSDVSDSEGLKRKRRRTVLKRRPSTKSNIRKTKCIGSNFSGVKNLSKSEGKIKFQKNSACSSATPKTKRFSVKSEKPNGNVDPKQMKLKSMLVVQDRGGRLSRVSSSNTRKQATIFPKFANVDPSIVLSTLFLHRNAREFQSSKKPIALFFTKKIPSAKSTFQQNGNHQHYFKKMQRDMYCLRKKYQMLDLITLDSYYALSEYSLRRTEIMLLDLISGREVHASGRLDTPALVHNHLKTDSRFHVQHCQYGVPIVSYNKSQFSEILVKPLYNSDEWFHKVVIEAMRVLYCEEAVLT